MFEQISASSSNMIPMISLIAGLLWNQRRIIGEIVGDNKTILTYRTKHCKISNVSKDGEFALNRINGSACVVEINALRII